jgi:hypothetical protein
VVGLGWLLNLVHGFRDSDTPVGPLRSDPGDEARRWVWRLFGWRRVAEIVFGAWLLGALYVINSRGSPTCCGSGAGDRRV